MRPDKKRKSKAKTLKKQIYIVDDHPFFRKGLAQYLEEERDFTICGEAGDAVTALEQLPDLEPDLIIVDITLKDGMDGLELTKTIYSMWPDILVIVLSMHRELLYAERVLRAGARGYISKEEPPSNVVAAIRKVLDGKLHVSGEMTEHILAKFVKGQPDAGGTPLDCLTNRELEVFRLIGQGFTTKELALKLCISHKTVETHKAKIKDKLDLHSAAELMKFAFNWLQSDHPDQ
ncbi:MAG: response regulator transcription factor [Planctomycetota bacterium]|jgi:DNA-binding NarL/FixJ family response regulator